VDFELSEPVEAFRKDVRAFMEAHVTEEDGPGALALVRPPEEDLFR